MTATDTKECCRLRHILMLLGTVFITISLFTYEPLDIGFYTSDPNIPALNRTGRLGAVISGYLLFLPFGFAAWAVPLFTFFWASSAGGRWGRRGTIKKTGGALLGLLSASGLFALTEIDTSQGHFLPGGVAGLRLSELMLPWLGKWGTVIVLSGALLTGSSQAVGVAAANILSALASSMKFLYARIKPALGKLKRPVVIPGLKHSRPPADEPGRTPPAPPPPTPAREKPVKALIKKTRVEPPNAQAGRPGSEGGFNLPPLELLSLPRPPGRDTAENTGSMVKALQDALHSYGVNCRVADVNIGPIVSSFEVEPARGVKLSQITSLADDIALVMKTQSVRISPIPGKSVVGVEVPNKNPRFVHLREVLQSEAFKAVPPPLALGLGTDILGRPLTANLADMPHLLIAGTTGSGKTICLNAIILSILFNASPEEIRFLMVDPKRVELNVFEGMPHLIAPVVTNSKKAAKALRWVVEEMDKRYFMLSKAGVRNISSFNKISNSGMERMSHLVVVIDELHDLMMVAQSAVEETITRLAQLSRAVGIHLVIATQRPSVDVITGVIKANLPCRISFQVSSKTDSRTILDANGAERLIGKGDMLFLPPGKGTLIRAQCSLVSDEETSRVADFLKSQRPPDYAADMPGEEAEADMPRVHHGPEVCEDDELYEEAVKIVLAAGKGSTSLLQRRLNIGYSRAARLLDMMEERGLISPARGTKPRIVLKGGEKTGE